MNKESIGTQKKGLTPASNKKGKKGKIKPTSNKSKKNLTLDIFYDSIPKLSQEVIPGSPVLKRSEEFIPESPYPFKCMTPEDKIFYGLDYLNKGNTLF